MRELFIVILLATAIFLSLMPHNVHEVFYSKLGIKKTPPHLILVLLGILLFITATIVSQKDYLDSLYKSIKMTQQIAGALVSRFSKISNKAVKKIPSFEQVADKIETFVDKVEINI